MPDAWFFVIFRIFENEFSDQESRIKSSFSFDRDTIPKVRKYFSLSFNVFTPEDLYHKWVVYACGSKFPGLNQISSAFDSFRLLSSN